MNNLIDVDLLPLIKSEGWEVQRDGQAYFVELYGERFPITHPAAIHLKLYRTLEQPEIRYQHLKKAHDYLWPDSIWHFWTERRFREHCAGWNYMGWAGGASAAKSYDAAKLGVLFWLAHPKKRGLLVASTTLTSVQKRVWGYVTSLLSSMKVKFPFQYIGGQSPSILFPVDRKDKTQIKDTRHGIFAVAAKTGTEESVISGLIGTHPDDALMIILDECTDLNPAIAKAFTNLDSSTKPFQIIGIGNSNSTTDLHGALCTPKEGWNTVDPEKDVKWETTQKNGICLFFSCYESPAVLETDPVRRKKLGRFLITQEQITEKEKLLGKDSDQFRRFVLGFWRVQSGELRTVSHEFIEEKQVLYKPEWSGLYALNKVAGLDIAFSTGGDSCILQVGVIGQTADGSVVLDFDGTNLTYEIQIFASKGDASLQIARQVQDILNTHGIPLEHLCIDATGQGRAMSGTLMLQMHTQKPPIKIYSNRTGEFGNAVKSFDVLVKTPYELWQTLRTYVENSQIKRLSQIAIDQLVNRKILINEKTKKPVLETKKEFKSRMAAVNPGLAHSPDQADTCALCLQSAIINFGMTPGLKQPIALEQAAQIDKYAVWKHTVRMAQQQHVVDEPVREMPKVGFSSGIETYVKMRRPF